MLLSVKKQCSWNQQMANAAPKLKTHRPKFEPCQQLSSWFILLPEFLIAGVLAIVFINDII